MKKNKLTVQDIEISLTQIKDEDYICLTDMVKSEEGSDHIRNWMRNRNTIEYLGTWELLNNPSFKGVEFDTIRSNSGTNSYKISVKEWVLFDRFIF